MNGRMRRVTVFVGIFLILGSLTAFGIFLAMEGLERADQWSSVVAAFVALVGLALAVAPPLRHEQSGNAPSVSGPLATTITGAVHVYDRCTVSSVVVNESSCADGRRPKTGAKS